jgi:hypothetical protein
MVVVVSCLTYGTFCISAHQGIIATRAPNRSILTGVYDHTRVRPARVAGRWRVGKRQRFTARGVAVYTSQRLLALGTLCRAYDRKIIVRWGETTKMYN